jgi:pSer/pThr/pTyr-binding forkhead associated (FHA) protein
MAIVYLFPRPAVESLVFQTGMGTDESLKKMPTTALSYMKSLKNFPTRFRKASKGSSGDSIPASKGMMGQSLPALGVDQEGAEEDSTETDTVAPSKVVTTLAAPKLVVRATVSQTPAAEDTEFSDPNTSPHLVYLTSYGGNMNYALTRSETHIGRKDDNHIILTDTTISKFHALVFRKSDLFVIVSNHRITVTDRNSSNGVRVNDQFIAPMVPTQLRNGDIVMIGSIKLLFYENLAAIPKQQIKNSEDNLKLVTILPSHITYDEKIAIKAELEEENVDFKNVNLVTDINVLKEDYEKLRLAYELSKVTLTVDLSVHLEKALDLIFEILPVDRGVVLLVDQNTGTLSTHQVKLRSSDEEGKEIILSSTILKRVYESRKVLVTMDASRDKSLQAAASVLHSQMRTVICLPLVGHNKVNYAFNGRSMVLYIWMPVMLSLISQERIYQL